MSEQPVSRRTLIGAAATIAALLGFGTSVATVDRVQAHEPEVDAELLAWLQAEQPSARAVIDQLRVELHAELDRATFRRVWRLADRLALETAAHNAALCVGGIRCGSQGLGRTLL